LDGGVDALERRGGLDVAAELRLGQAGGGGGRRALIELPHEDRGHRGGRRHRGPARAVAAAPAGGGPGGGAGGAAGAAEAEQVEGAARAQVVAGGDVDVRRGAGPSRRQADQRGRRGRGLLGPQVGRRYGHGRVVAQELPQPAVQVANVDAGGL